ncbi:MAG: hypothetical protein K2Q25_05860 [Mycobacteriaceae bacterium]|nr:hypothetical protein [Mycobacteriaceae bacterium]
MTQQTDTTGQYPTTTKRSTMNKIGSACIATGALAAAALGLAGPAAAAPASDIPTYHDHYGWHDHGWHEHEWHDGAGVTVHVGGATAHVGVSLHPGRW